ncbi:hypothetical protein SAMN05428959_102852 [Duganella sp. CF517]|uniref:hypothetical protein n=1 Tax=Duganella sp. CF517 TaxID=1881038 RepID=UPI0008B2C52D|nr:hypothetical protein [Duganella sp. CF517]SEN67331.1 hypothetical protein SAMN05428959_102852 [Duganella sp. CF517]
MRKIVLGTAAVATLLAAWFAPEQDGGVVGPAAATPRELSAPAIAPRPDVAPAEISAAEMAPAPGVDLQIHSRVADDELGNVFAKQSWAPQSPLKVMAEQTAPPRQGATPSGPPPLPFQFMGRFTDDGKTAYFLQIDGQNVVARPGEKINDSYLLDSVSGDTMNFIYLPLNQKQSLAVGDTN